MLTWAKKYTNAKEAYNAHLVSIDFKVEEKLESSKQVVLIESSNKKSQWRSLVYFTIDIGFHQGTRGLGLFIVEVIVHL